MKTIGRIVIILLAAAIVSGAAWGIVNASGALDNAAAFDDREEFRPDGTRQIPPEGFDRDFDREDEGFSVFSLIGILGKGIVIAVIMAVILIPQKFLANRKAQTPA
jgi:hypothetical protein